MDKIFLDRFFGTIDAFKSLEFSEFFAEDAEWVFANASPLIGRAMIASNAQTIFDQLGGIRHRLVNHWVIAQTLFTEGEVTYLRKEGKELKLPFFTVSDFNSSGLIASYRTYIDPSPLYQS
ncbi:MAG: nuclear transport factor 2 family protein [Bdellovibrionota bacterium]